MLSETILRLPAVKAATGLSRSSIYQRVKLGTFPPPVPLGGKSVGWPESEIDGWIAQTIAAGRKRGENYSLTKAQRRLLEALVSLRFGWCSCAVLVGGNRRGNSPNPRRNFIAFSNNKNAHVIPSRQLHSRPEHQVQMPAARQAPAPREPTPPLPPASLSRACIPTHAHVARGGGSIGVGNQCCVIPMIGRSSLQPVQLFACVRARIGSRTHATRDQPA